MSQSPCQINTRGICIALISTWHSSHTSTVLCLQFSSFIELFCGLWCSTDLYCCMICKTYKVYSNSYFKFYKIDCLKKKLYKIEYGTIPVSLQNSNIITLTLNCYMSTYTLHAVLFGEASLCVAVNATLPPTGPTLALPAAAVSWWAQGLALSGRPLWAATPRPRNTSPEQGQKGQASLALTGCPELWTVGSSVLALAPSPPTTQTLSQPRAHERAPCAINSWAAHREQTLLPQLAHTYTHR